jgi:hypothetical protein
MQKITADPYNDAKKAIRDHMDQIFWEPAEILIEGQLINQRDRDRAALFARAYELGIAHRDSGFCVHPMTCACYQDAQHWDPDMNREGIRLRDERVFQPGENQMDRRAGKKLGDKPDRIH